MATVPSAGAWVVEQTERSATELLAALEDRPPPRRWARVGMVTRPALVLGSTQRDDVVDGAAVVGAGADVARRRTGGGAVWVAPGAQVWLDLWLPAGDPLQVDDVGASFAWLGDVWVAALASLGVHGVMRPGPWVPGRWGRLVCFAGLGAGEVTVSGRKVVGLAQRRTRAGTWFQAMALLRWEPRAWAGWLRAPGTPAAELVRALEPVATGLPLDGGALTRAVVAHLP